MGTAGSRCVARTLLSKTGKLTAKAIDLLTRVPESKTWKGIYDTGIDFHTELGGKKITFWTLFSKKLAVLGYIIT